MTKQKISTVLAGCTIQQRLLCGFAVVLGILVIVASQTLVSLSKTRQELDVMTQQAQPSMIASMELMHHVTEASAAMGFFLLTKEKHYEESYQHHLAAIDAPLTTLREALASQQDNDAEARLAKVESDIAKFKAYDKQVHLLATSILDNFVAVRFASDNLNPINRDFFQVISNMLTAEDMETSTPERRALRKSITDLRYAWSNVTNNVRIFLTFGSDDILQNVRLFLESSANLIKDIKGRSDLFTLEQEEGIVTIDDLYGRWVNFLDQLVELHRGDKARMDAHLLRTEIGPLLERIDIELKQLTAGKRQAIDESSAGLISQATDTSNTVKFLLVVGLVLGIGISLLITRLISVPLKKAAAAMRDIADGEGDLTQRLEVVGSDEIAELSKGFNHFVDQIQTIVSQVQEASGHMKKAVGDMNRTTRATEQTIRDQRGEVDQAATAINQMAATAHEVASNAEMTADAANNANQQTATGRKIVNQALDSIQTLADRTQESAGSIEQLGLSIQEISSVIDVIRGIAEQTNLLALNAAIEAARAGEQGRGFAVVADEVRTLATRTKDSTSDIQNKVVALQGAANIAVSGMLANRSIADDTMKFAGAAGGSLDQITDAVNRITEMTTQIANAAEQQSAVTEEINKGITRIHQMADSTDQQAEQISFASTSLSQISETLLGLVGKFRT